MGTKSAFQRYARQTSPSSGPPAVSLAQADIHRYPRPVHDRPNIVSTNRDGCHSLRTPAGPARLHQSPRAAHLESWRADHKRPGASRGDWRNNVWQPGFSLLSLAYICMLLGLLPQGGERDSPALDILRIFARAQPTTVLEPQLYTTQRSDAVRCVRGGPGWRGPEVSRVISPAG